jgi:HD-GYP domain-containing protein (c-di-GMP phosphodiesterase class II)
MNGNPNEKLSLLVGTSFGALIRELAEVLETPMAVLGSDGGIILETQETAGRRGPESPKVEARISAPIETEDGVIGSVVASSPEPKLEPLLAILGSHMGECSDLDSDLCDMTDQLSYSYDEISLIYRLGKIIKSDENLSSNARRLVEETSDLLESRFIVVSLPEEDCFIWSSSPGLIISESLQWLAANESALRRIHSDLACDIGARGLPDESRHQGSVFSPFGRIQYVVTPVWVRSAVVGYAGLFRTDEDKNLTTSELRLVECLVQQIAGAATTQALHHELYELLLDVVKSLVTAIEAKDEYTRGHSERVFRLSVLIARRLGLPAKEMRTLTWAALLHDIGKIAVSGKILRKPGRLTDEEFGKVRTHPERGCMVLEPIRQLGKVLPAIRHHHERFDGTGYPDRLKGMDIPLLARIIFVADAFDAIVSARPYRPPGTLDYAISEIQRGAGNQFDPRIVRVFTEVAREGELAYSGVDMGGSTIPLGHTEPPPARRAKRENRKTRSSQGKSCVGSRNRE